MCFVLTAACTHVQWPEVLRGRGGCMHRGTCHGRGRAVGGAGTGQAMQGHSGGALKAVPQCWWTGEVHWGGGGQGGRHGIEECGAHVMRRTLSPIVRVAAVERARGCVYVRGRPPSQRKAPLAMALKRPLV